MASTASNTHLWATLWITEVICELVLFSLFQVSELLVYCAWKVDSDLHFTVGENQDLYEVSDVLKATGQILARI